MEVLVLGGLSVRDGDTAIDVGGARPQTLLALLVTHLGQSVSTGTLIDGVWGEDLPDRPRKALQVLISNLRRELSEHATITTTATGYRLESDGVGVDAREFERWVAKARRLDGGATAAIEAALALWRGEPFESLESDALAPEARRLTEIHDTAEELHAETLLDQGRHEEAIGTLESLVAQQPLRESRWELLMVGLYRAGRQADALAAFQRARRVLAEELGLQPSRRLVELEQQILEQRPILEPSRRPASAPGNPYRGLLAFGETDAESFFGREEFIARLLARVGSDTFLALVGPSGSGKSSVLAAGLVPQLRSGAVNGSDDWVIATMRPGPNPWMSMAGALADAVGEDPTLDGATVGSLLNELAPNRTVLLVIDQAEELYTAGSDTATRYLGELVEAVRASAVRVVLGIRADFYDRFLAHREVGRLLAEGTVALPPMTPEELRRAVAGPAERAGAAVEPSFLAQIVDDVVDEPGALPLLQFVLTEMYAADPHDMSLDRYVRLGGLTGAMSQRADTLYGGLDDRQQPDVREIMLRLIALGEGTRDTRRRVFRNELTSRRDSAEEVVDLLVRHRLLALDRDALTRRPTVDLAHEAIITGWHRLGTWIDEARTDLRRRQAISQAAQEWRLNRKEDGFLLSAGRVAAYEDWRPTSSVTLTEAEQEFVDASIAKRDADTAAAEAQAQRELELERTARRRLVGVAAVLAIAAFVAGILGIAAADNARDAAEQRDDAQRQRATAEAAQTTAEEQRAEAQRLEAEAEASLEVLRAEALAATAMELTIEDAELAALLAVEAAARADELSLPLDASVAALHVALQELGASFPTPPGPAQVAVVDAASERRGVFVMPVADLLAVTEQTVKREMSADECQQHLLQACPDRSAWERIAPATLESTILERETAFPQLLGTNVDIGVALNVFGTSTFVRTFDDSDVYPLDLANTLSINAPSVTTSILGIPEISDRECTFGGTTSAETTSLPTFVDVLIVGYADRFHPCIERLGPRPDFANVLDDARLGRYIPPTLDERLTNEDGRWGLWVRWNPWGIWYRNDLLDAAAIQAPASWDALVQAVAQLDAAGLGALCVDPATPLGLVPLAILIESRIVANGGIAFHDDWSAGRVALDHVVITQAHREVGDLLFGSDRDVQTMSGNDAQAFLAERPTCHLWVAPSSWIHAPNRIRATPAPLSVAKLPMGLAGGSIVNGSVAIMMEDSPETRAVMGQTLRQDYGHLSAQARVVSTLAASMRLPPDVYIDPALVELASLTREAARSDTMRVAFFAEHPLLYLAYVEGIQRWLAEGPDVLDEVLADVQAAWDAMPQSG